MYMYRVRNKESEMQGQMSAVHINKESVLTVKHIASHNKRCFWVAIMAGQATIWLLFGCFMENVQWLHIILDSACRDAHYYIK